MALARCPWIALACVLAFLIVGCTNSEEHASFEILSEADLPECMAEQFPFEPTFLSAKTYNERTGLFLQSPSDHRSYNDGVNFELYNPDDISPGEPIELGDASVPPPAARGKMVFFSSCAYEHDTLTLHGTLHFDSFDPEVDGIITGELRDARAVDARTGETKIEDLSGTWSFRVRAGPPHEDFYAVPQRP